MKVKALLWNLHSRVAASRARSHHAAEKCNGSILRDQSFRDVQEEFTDRSLRPHMNVHFPSTMKKTLNLPPGWCGA